MSQAAESSLSQISAEDLGAWWEVEVNIGINGDYSLPMGIGTNQHLHYSNAAERSCNLSNADKLET